MFKKPTPKVFLTGESGSGKTTLLYILKLNEVITTIPTIGFNVETIQLWNQNYAFWDVTFNQLPMYFSQKIEDLAGFVHLCRDGSEIHKKSILTVVYLLKQKNLIVPILILLNEDGVFPSTFEAEMRNLMQYEGKVNFRKLNIFNSLNPVAFIEDNFPEMFSFFIKKF